MSWKKVITIQNNLNQKLIKFCFKLQIKKTCQQDVYLLHSNKFNYHVQEFILRTRIWVCYKVLNLRELGKRWLEYEKNFLESEEKFSNKY